MTLTTAVLLHFCKQYVWNGVLRKSQNYILPRTLEARVSKHSSATVDR